MSGCYSFGFWGGSWFSVCSCVSVCLFLIHVLFKLLHVLYVYNYIWVKKKKTYRLCWVFITSFSFSDIGKGLQWPAASHKTLSKNLYRSPENSGSFPLSLKTLNYEECSTHKHKNFYLHYYPAFKRYIYILNCLAKPYSDIMKLLFIMTVWKPLMSRLFKYGKPQFSENQVHKVEERWKKNGGDF